MARRRIFGGLRVNDRPRSRLGILTDSMIKCAVHGTEHGSDHGTIETVFGAPWTAPTQTDKLLLENVPWKEINARIARTLAATPVEGSVQQKTDRLMCAVSETVRALMPKAKPSPHAKRWWTADLTQLRQIYTHWRNHAPFGKTRGAKGATAGGHGRKRREAIP